MWYIQQKHYYCSSSTWCPEANTIMFFTRIISIISWGESMTVSQWNNRMCHVLHVLKPTQVRCPPWSVLSRLSGETWQFHNETDCMCQALRLLKLTKVDGILPKGPYLPCVSMAGRALWQDTIEVWRLLWTFHFFSISISGVACQHLLTNITSKHFKYAKVMFVCFSINQRPGIFLCLELLGYWIEHF